ncbi:amidohydrolase family protein [Wenzhouxiangellaceae bacterium CH-27]|uniref:Amidohydrolase family protein n=2 Tax=Elongatibacter sediminis TaxID=3119006 RepID=A0AAW9RK42_9GAMM
MPFDTLIVNGTLIDGSGAPRFRADIGIRHGKIARIGDLASSRAEHRIDAGGLIVAPGFIDVHTHAERGLVSPELNDNKGFITQGVTTCVIGADGGHSPRSIRELRETFEAQGVGTHYAFLVGVNAVRKEVIGMEDRAPTQAELEQMKSLVRQAMENGAVGLSSGLMYLPARYATTEEVVELARVAADYDGLYDSHVRNAVPDFEGAYREAIEIGLQSGARPHPAHYKAVGMRNWGKTKPLNDWFQSQIDQGVDLTVDAYPYDGAATALLVDVFAVPREDGMPVRPPELRDPLLDAGDFSRFMAGYVADLQQALRDPARREAIRVATEVGIPGVYSVIAFAAEGYDTLRIVASEPFPELEGQMILDIAARRGQPPFDVMADLLFAAGPEIKVTLAAAVEDDIREILRRPWTMIASDGSNTGFDNGRGHPRSRGTFPRVLGRYVREWGVLTLEDAIRKMTWLPASYYRFAERGLLREGFRADITVFDPDTVIDRSTWQEPARYSEGVIHVLVNGEPVLSDGHMTGALPGEFLPRADQDDVDDPGMPIAGS